MYTLYLGATRNPNVEKAMEYVKTHPHKSWIAISSYQPNRVAWSALPNVTKVYSPKEWTNVHGDHDTHIIIDFVLTPEFVAHPHFTKSTEEWILITSRAPTVISSDVFDEIYMSCTPKQSQLDVYAHYLHVAKTEFKTLTEKDCVLFKKKNGTMKKEEVKEVQKEVKKEEREEKEEISFDSVYSHPSTDYVERWITFEVKQDGFLPTEAVKSECVDPTLKSILCKTLFVKKDPKSVNKFTFYFQILPKDPNKLQYFDLAFLRILSKWKAEKKIEHAALIV